MTVLSRHAPIAPVTPGAPSAPRADERASRSFFPEIQVLRAVAVMLVVLYHYWPDTLTGGYVGVDAFSRHLRLPDHLPPAP